MEIGVGLSKVRRDARGLWVCRRVVNASVEILRVQVFGRRIVLTHRYATQSGTISIPPLFLSSTKGWGTITAIPAIRSRLQVGDGGAFFGFRPEINGRGKCFTFGCAKQNQSAGGLDTRVVAGEGAQGQAGWGRQSTPRK